MWERMAHVCHTEEGQTVIALLRDIGLRSEHAYLAGMLSIGASIAAWASSRTGEDVPAAKAERWGIFIGLWAPTFVEIGNALRVDEKADAV